MIACPAHSDGNSPPKSMQNDAKHFVTDENSSAVLNG